MTRTALRRHAMPAIAAAAVVSTTLAVAQETAPATAPASAPAVRTDLPAASDLVQRAIDAMGGRKAFESIDSAAIMGNMSTPMGDMSIEMYSARPGKFLMKQVMPGGMGEVSAGSDGTVGWAINPMMGGPQILEGDQVDGMKNQAQIYELVLRVEDESQTLETIDQAEFRGSDCYKVRMVNNEGQEEFAFFNVENGLIAGVETTQEGGAVPAVVTIAFEDWKQFGEIRGFAKMIVEQMGMAMEMNFTEVTFNEVDAAMFELPEEVASLAKERATSQPASQPE